MKFLGVLFTAAKDTNSFFPFFKLVKNWFVSIYFIQRCIIAAFENLREQIRLNALINLMRFIRFRRVTTSVNKNPTLLNCLFLFNYYYLCKIRIFIYNYAFKNGATL